MYRNVLIQSYINWQSLSVTDHNDDPDRNNGDSNKVVLTREMSYTLLKSFIVEIICMQFKHMFM